MPLVWSCSIFIYLQTKSLFPSSVDAQMFFLILHLLPTQRLQFSDMPTASLSRQQHKGTPHRHPSDQSDAFSTPLSVFPWERDDSRPTSRRRLPPSPQTPGPDVINQGLLEQGVGGKEEHKTEAEGEWGCSAVTLVTWNEWLLRICSLKMQSTHIQFTLADFILK